MNLAQGLAHVVKVAGKRPAICCESEYTWSQFAHRTDCLARGLAQVDVRRGDRVAVLMHNCHRYFELYFACVRMGAVIVPINIRLAQPEIDFILQDSEASVLIVDTIFVEYAQKQKQYGGVQQIVYSGPPDSSSAGMQQYEDLVTQGAAMQTSADVVTGDDDLFGLFYTGGTTGRAKGVMLSHKNIVFNAIYSVTHMGISAHDVYLHAAPLFHVADLSVGVSAAMVGACQVFLPAFQPVQVLQKIQAHKVTITLLVPTMINALLHHPEADNYDIASLRKLLYGAAPMPVELLKQGLKRWGQIFFQGYGMTEAAGGLTSLVPSEHIVDGTPEQMRRLGSCGKPVLGVEVRVVNEEGEDVRPGEVGEIIARGPGVMLGYWRMPEVTSEILRDSWLHSGDLATVDEENYIFIVDRAKDMIISGGENIYSVEVEQALSTHPAVLEVAVFGIPHEHWGEAVHAVVVHRPGVCVKGEDLIAYARTQIAGYKVPRSIEVRSEALPKSGVNKILKRMLREQYCQRKS